MKQIPTEPREQPDSPKDPRPAEKQNTFERFFDKTLFTIKGKRVKRGPVVLMAVAVGLLLVFGG